MERLPREIRVLLRRINGRISVESQKTKNDAAEPHGGEDADKIAG